MSDQVDAKQEQLAALNAAEEQQLAALEQQRTAALESAEFWENLTLQATAGLVETQPGLVPPPAGSAALLTNAHFTFLESMVKAQAEFSRTLLGGLAPAAGSADGGDAGDTGDTSAE